MVLKDRVPADIKEAINLYSNGSIVEADKIHPNLFRLSVRNKAKIKTSELKDWKLKESAVDSRGTATWLFERV